MVEKEPSTWSSETLEPSEVRDTGELRARFRVSLFGTSSDSDRLSAEIAARITEGIVGSSGFRIATGGQKHGTMRAAAERAHAIAQELKRPDLEPVGVAMERWEPLEIGDVETVDTLQKRLQKLIDESDGFVTVTGGIGTFVETVNVLHGVNIEKGRDVYKKPLVICDPTLKQVQMMRYLEREFGVFRSNPELEKYVFVINNPGHAERIMEVFYRKKNGFGASEDDELFLQAHSIRDHLKDQV